MRLRSRDDLFDSMLATEEEEDFPEDEEDEHEEEEDPDAEESEWDTSIDDAQRIEHYADDE